MQRARKTRSGLRKCLRVWIVVAPLLAGAGCRGGATGAAGGLLQRIGGAFSGLGRTSANLGGTPNSTRRAGSANAGGAPVVVDEDPVVVSEEPYGQGISPDYYSQPILTTAATPDEPYYTPILVTPSVTGQLDPSLPWKPEYLPSED